MLVKVATGGLLPVCTRTSAGTVMTKLRSPYIHTPQALEGSILMSSLNDTSQIIHDNVIVGKQPDVAMTIFLHNTGTSPNLLPKWEASIKLFHSLLTCPLRQDIFCARDCWWPLETVRNSHGSDEPTMHCNSNIIYNIFRYPHPKI